MHDENVSLMVDKMRAIGWSPTKKDEDEDAATKIVDTVAGGSTSKAAHFQDWDLDDDVDM